MPESMLSGYQAALGTLRRIGWTVRVGTASETIEAGSGPVLVVPTDAEAAFDSAGNLTRPLDLGRHGVGADAQVAFAAQDLILVLALDEDAGTATVLPHGTPERDLQVILRALAELRRRGYVAEAALAFTVTDGWQAARSRGDGSKVVFWTTQDHEDAFDRDTDLVGDLPLQWAGDPEEIAEVLAGTDLEVRVPESEETVFYLAPHYIEE
jgi:hypothetical protein